MIHVIVPPHLRTLANINGEVMLTVEGPITQRSVLDALESRFPTLQGTVREHVTRKRRPLLRFFASGLDLSHQNEDVPLPDTVASGVEPFWIVGAIAGG